MTDIVTSTTNPPPAPASVVGACGHGPAITWCLSGVGLPFLMLESDLRLRGAKTSLARLEQVANINGPGLVDALLALWPLMGGNRKPMFFLSNDRMVRTVGSAWDRLEDSYALSWSDLCGTLLPLLDKSALEQRCADCGMAFPSPFLLAFPETARRAAETIGFPIFVKLARPLTGFKTAQPGAVEELEHLARDRAANLPLLVQGLMPDEDTAIYLGALYLDRGAVLARFVGHKLLSLPLAHTTVAESCFDDEVHRVTCQFFEGLHLSGPVSLELKRDPDDTLWVIEPMVRRTDFWIDLCTTNNVNFPLLEYRHQTPSAVGHPRQQDQAIWSYKEDDPFSVHWFPRKGGLKRRGPRPDFTITV